MTTLGQLLIQQGLITAGQVEEALRRQQELGGRLGTCLLEIGAIDEHQLDTALVSQLGIPAAVVEDLRDIPEAIHSLLPANLAISCEAVPFRVRDDQVDVAILEIKNRGLHDELAFVIGKWIHVHIANEVRIFEALRRYYGKDCTPRYSALLERLDAERESKPPPTRESVQSELDDLFNVPFPDLEAPAAEPEEPESGPDSSGNASDTELPAQGPKLVYPPSPMRRHSIELTSEERAALRRSVPAEPAEPAGTPASPPPSDRPAVSEGSGKEGAAAAGPPRREHREAAHETVELPPKATVEPHPSAPWKADSAEEIGRNLLRELGRRFHRVALYRVTRQGVKSWLGRGEGFDDARFAGYEAALGRGSVFDSLASGGHLYVGRLTRTAAHDELLDAIGAEPGTECMFSAISVGGRVVALSYADHGSEGLAEADLGAVQQLSVKAGEAMRELILRRKRKQA